MNTDSIISTQKSSFAKRTVVISTIVLALAVVFIVSIPTLVWMGFGPGSLFAQPVHRFVSPDNSYEILVSRRVAFPIIDPSAPSVIVRVDLKKAGAFGAFNYVEFEIHEYQELMEPEIHWTPTDVKIDKIDWHNELTFIIRLPDQFPTATSTSTIP